MKQKKSFDKSVSFGNAESIDENRKLQFNLNKEESINYFEEVLDKECTQAMYKYGIIFK